MQGKFHVEIPSRTAHFSLVKSVAVGVVEVLALSLPGGFVVDVTCVPISVSQVDREELKPEEVVSMP